MNGKYILVGYHFNEDGANILFDKIDENSTQRIKFPIFGKSFTLINHKQRFCIGRHDLQNGISIPCPDKAVISEAEYDMCPECFRFTGFNPAFYNSDYISDQQKQYNENPHIVYLANFGYGYNKVGISNARRGINRLLEQGARSAIILDTFETAYKAREIEATISEHFHQIRETFRDNTKRKLILEKYSLEQCKTQLLHLSEKIEEYIGYDLINKEFIDCSKYYFYNSSLSNLIVDVTYLSNFVSGKCIGMIGGTILVENDNRQYIYSIKELVGNLVEINDQTISFPQSIRTTQGGLF